MAQVTASDNTARQISALVEKHLCAGVGLRCEMTSFDLAVRGFETHDGRVVDLEVPVLVRFVQEASYRAKVATENGLPIIVIVSLAKAEKKEIGGTIYIHRNSSDFNVYKSTLIHELTHVLDIVTGIDRFKRSEMEKVYTDPDEYKVRYRTSSVEVRAYLRQLLWVLSEKLEERMQTLTLMRNPTKESLSNYDTYLEADPDALLRRLEEMKVVPLKLRSWLETLRKHSPESYAKVLTGIGDLQRQLRNKYQNQKYSGA